jgi:type I restriction enzyme R subunit
MERGIKVAGGDRIGKTIIFAQNKRHAEFILERFNKLYPQYKGSFVQRVICDDTYAQTIIDDFKQPEKEPHIAVSVDMMDTGIDVPQCVNLVFFKKVRSKTKFWQMIGRGTRLAPTEACIDQIDGEYVGKRRFLIFDYCGNFEYFREKPNGYEAKETKSLSENIFSKQVRIAAALQDGLYAEQQYQDYRKELVTTCQERVADLKEELAAVRLQRRYVEKYKAPQSFAYLSEGDKGELINNIAPLVYMEDKDEAAKRFDNFMYGLILAQIEGMPSFQYAKKQLCETAELLEKKVSIPQVQAKLPVIQSINSEDFWEANDILQFEMVRKELRELMKFLMDEGDSRKPIITRLFDPVIDAQEGVLLDPAYDFEDYRKKVNRYVTENGDTLAIYKLTHNIPLSAGDYAELERVLTQELGSKADYDREYGDTPFGLLVRRIAKLDHQAAMDAFSAFISNESLNQKQIAFVNKIINHIEQNGYMEDVKLLTKPPFDKPVSFVKLFDQQTRTALVQTINEVRENAVKVLA